MIVIVAGTRPELIKVAPLYLELKHARSPVELWLTGQHESLAEAPIQFFGIQVARQWKTLEPGQSSNVLLAKLLMHMDEALKQTKPRAVIVQGDTTSALAGALAAFHRKIPIAHVEAGLRTGDLKQPFPEEMNRRAIDSFADWLFPPTEIAEKALYSEGHTRVERPTGNTGIDALFWAQEKVLREGSWPQDLPRPPVGTRIILSTGHRHENLGAPLFRRALGEEVDRTPGVQLYHSAHPNPEATRIAVDALHGFKNVKVIPPLGYPEFVSLLNSAAVVVSDSGGIQEEAPSIRMPILITREVTERPEVLSCGGVLVGSNPELIQQELRRILAHKSPLDRSPQVTPFGDGRASQRIIRKIFQDLNITSDKQPFLNDQPRRNDQMLC